MIANVSPKEVWVLEQKCNPYTFRNWVERKIRKKIQSVIPAYKGIQLDGHKIASKSLHRFRSKVFGLFKDCVAVVVVVASTNNFTYSNLTICSQ